MAGHPVEDHAHARLMAAVHEIPELIRVSKARSRREITRDLIAPRPRERMLRDRQQFEMRVAHLDDVRQQRVREFAVAEKAVALLRPALPRAEMHLVDAHRRAMPLLRAPRLQPRRVVPRVAFQIENERGRRRAVLAEKGERIALQNDRPVRLPDLEFVVRALADAGQENLPHPAAEQLPHRVAPPVPPVEFADHADPLRIRRPHVKRRPAHALDLGEVRAELFVKLPVLPLSEEMQIERPEQNPRGIRIMLRPRLPFLAGEIEHVAEALRRTFEHRFKKAVGVDLPRREERPAGVGRAHRHRARIGTKNTHDPLPGRVVHPEHRERIAVFRAEDRLERTGIDRGSVGGDLHAGQVGGEASSGAR